MQALLTAAEAKDLDRVAAERGVPVEMLMERAGFAVARTAARLAGGTYGRRAAIACGSGNNGGDGFVAARHLARWGMVVDVVLVDGQPAPGGAAAANLDRLRSTAVRVVGDPGGSRDAGSATDAVQRAVGRADVGVDAIFGVGFHGVAEPPQASAIEALNLGDPPVVAVDVPSGVEANTGLVRGPAVAATTTVTFGAPKLGIVLFPGASHAGRVEVADIGFPPELLVSDVRLVEEADIRALLPRRSPEDHKRRSGIVLVIGGSSTMTGAPRLVALGAFRAGAGLVRVAAPASAVPAIQAGLAEATFSPLEEKHGAATARGIDARTLDGVGAIAVGPGLSTAPGAVELVRRLVAEVDAPLVIDADAISAFAGAPGDLADRRSEAVLTPHTGELARLYGVAAEDVLADRIGFARRIAADARAVVLLKGPRTILASPDGEVRVNPTGSAALATGGTGDVLAGIVAAYLARGALPLEAATAAAFVHGAAGEMLAEGALASEVADAVAEAAERIRG